MTMQPETYIDKPRKLVHDIFKGIAFVSGGLALLGILAGGSFVPLLLICAGSAYVSSKIKFTWVKDFEARAKRYKLV